MAARQLQSGAARAAHGATRRLRPPPRAARRGAGEVRYAVDLSATPVFRILALANRFTNAFGELYGSRFGVGLPEWRTLAALGMHGPMPSIRIAELAQIDRGAISRAVAALERRGLLQREPDATDARKQLLRLTPAGVELHDRIAQFAIRRQTWLLDQFTSEEQAHLAMVLGKLERAVGALVREPEPGSHSTLARSPDPPTYGPELDRVQLLEQLERFKRLLLR